MFVYACEGVYVRLRGSYAGVDVWFISSPECPLVGDRCEKLITDTETQEATL